MNSTKSKDNSLRTAQILGDLTNKQLSKRDKLNRFDRQDFFRFTLSSSSSVSLTLGGLRANASIQFLNGTGNVIAASNNRANRPEQIQQSLEAGTYGIKVSLTKGQTPYKLQVTAVTPTPSPTVTPTPSPTVTPTPTPTSRVLPTQEWIRQIPSDNPATATTAYNYAGKLAIDRFGNTYVSGYTTSSIAGEANAGFFDAWFAKYSSDGTQQWIKRIATNANDYIEGLVTDNVGNIYLSGATGSEVANRAGAFIAKYDSDGTQLWIDNTIKSSTLGDLPEAKDIAIDRSGNLFITGITFGTLGGTDNGSFDAWVAKYRNDGTRLWIRQLGTAGFDTANSVAVDSVGNAYVGGGTPGTLGTTNAGGPNDAWFAKYSPEGDRLWTRQFGTSGSSGEEVQGIAIDSTDNIYLTGTTPGATGGFWTENKPWIVRYNTSGDLLWSKQYGTFLTDVYDISVDASNNIYTVGRTQNFFGSTTGSWNAYFAKFNGDGVNLWGEVLTTPWDDRAYSLAVDSGKLYVMGSTGGSLGRTNPRSPVFDVWLARYSSL